MSRVPSTLLSANLFAPCRYCCYLYFQLKTHKEVATAEEGDGDDEGGEVGTSLPSLPALAQYGRALSTLSLVVTILQTGLAYRSCCSQALHCTTQRCCLGAAG